MTRTSEEHRGLGANIIQRLLQHRRPFLFVDRIKRYRLGEARSIEAAFHVSVSHSVFDGHFPDWSATDNPETGFSPSQRCANDVEGLALVRLDVASRLG